MLDNIRNEQVLFVDIETVPQHASYENLPPVYKAYWEKKSANFRKNDEAAEDVYQRAGIYAEFGKIICISAGFIHEKDGEKAFRVKSLYGDNEKVILEDFKELLNGLTSKNYTYLCAHNGKEFDFPYIARRMLINGIKLPTAIDNAGKKPWEVPYLDTLELWKFGDYKHYTSLDLLCYIFNITDPKDDIDGSMVADVYYQENDIDRIVSYCEKDVFAVAQLFLRYKSDPLIPKDNVEYIRA